MKINLEKLQPNTTFKNYKDMCNQLEMEVKSSTNSKNAQYKELSRLCKYIKDGHKIIIEEVYEIPLDKIENRGGSHNNIYGNIVQLLILDLLAQANGHLTISRSNLMSNIGMTNENYNGCRENLHKLSKYIGVNIGTIYDFYNTTNSSFKGIIEGALNKLEDKRIIFTEKVIKIKKCHKKYTSIAIQSEKNDILKIEKEVLEELGYDEVSSVRVSKDWNVFKKETNSRLYDAHGIEFYFTAYKITINNDYIELECNKLKDLILEEVVRLDNKKELNSLVKNNINKNASNRNENSFKASKKLSRIRSKSTYVSDINKISDLLINRTTPNLVSDIMKTELLMEVLPQEIMDEIDALF